MRFRDILQELVKAREVTTAYFVLRHVTREIFSLSVYQFSRGLKLSSGYPHFSIPLLAVTAQESDARGEVAITSNITYISQQRIILIPNI